MATRIALEVDGRAVEVDDDGASLLEVLRDRLGLRGPKDGCSPQGQCGCCTVLVDGAPRVACVTPVRRVQGKRITTVDGLDLEVRQRWADAFVATGGSQCGFCTPGIVCRLAGDEPTTRDQVDKALAAHLCRCTGWQTIVEAVEHRGPAPERDLEAAGRRASIEGGVPQEVGPHVVLRGGGFADDTAPADALVAVPDGQGGWGVGETLSCGTGTAAAALAVRHWAGALAPHHWRVEVPGGTLAVRMFPTQDGEHVALSGPAQLVYTGQISLAD